MAKVLKPKLTAPATKAKVSVAKCHNAWYVGCASKELKSKPLKVTILGIPMVLFRTESGVPGALLDRCPHRNVPLSIGEVDGEILRCGYHGWEFGTDGACKHLPCFTGEPNTKGHAATAYPVREEQGFVWIYANSEEEPQTTPFQIPLLGDERYTHVYQVVEAPGTMHATIENALDVPHTAFLHRGLFRSAGKTNAIDVVVRKYRDRVEAQYIGEPRPEGVVGRLLSPGGGEVEHYDRFFLPSVAQVEYKIGDDSHILITSLWTPVGDFETKLFTVVSFRLARLPEWVVGTLLKPIGKRIFKQDADMLAEQTALIERFGGEQFVSTEVDVLGGEIWRLLKAAERGDVVADGSHSDDSEEPVTKHLTMNV